MNYKIVVDSCCDLTEEMKGWTNLVSVPLLLQIGDYKTYDDDLFDQDDFISRMLAYDGVAKSACPSPEAFKNAYEGDEDCVFVLTITDKLSGSYNSALQGKALFQEENGEEKKIHVFNSLATSGLETLIAMEIKRLADLDTPYEELIQKTEDYIKNRTALFFCLESLDALKKNGRLFSLAAAVLKKLRVKLICKRTQEGTIGLAGQDFAMNRALIKLSAAVSEDVKDVDLSDKTLIISHVCCAERAEFVASKITEKSRFHTVIILKASGLNSLYASNGGIIVSYSK